MVAAQHPDQDQSDNRPYDGERYCEFNYFPSVHGVACLKIK